jgi:hypothetical protein
MSKRMRPLVTPSPVDGFTVAQATAIAREVLSDFRAGKASSEHPAIVMKRRVARRTSSSPRLRVVRRKKK